MRTDKEQYSEFADWMVLAVHGKGRYSDRAGSIADIFSDFVPVSQEAFALLLYKNGYDNWLRMHNNAVSSSDEANEEEKPGYRYTNTKGCDGMVFTSRNGGWSQEGMETFNMLCNSVKDSRATDNGAFDEHCREHWRTTMRPSKYKRWRPTRQVQVATIYNDLEDPDRIPAGTPDYST
jgi:hypothetical protein